MCLDAAKSCLDCYKTLIRECYQAVSIHSQPEYQLYHDSIRDAIGLCVDFKLMIYNWDTKCYRPSDLKDFISKIMKNIMRHECERLELKINNSDIFRKAIDFISLFNLLREARTALVGAQLGEKASATDVTDTDQEESEATASSNIIRMKYANIQKVISSNRLRKSRQANVHQQSSSHDMEDVENNFNLLNIRNESLPSHHTMDFTAKANMIQQNPLKFLSKDDMNNLSTMLKEVSLNSMELRSPSQINDQLEMYDVDFRSNPAGELGMGSHMIQQVTYRY